MPNWCSNHLQIAGPAEAIKAFKEKALYTEGDKTVAFAFTALVPYPEKFRELDAIAQEARAKGDYSVKDGFNQGGYEWCCQNWGTKWDIFHKVWDDEGVDFLLADFDTAWNAPTEFFRTVAPLFPELTFHMTYEEPGMGFQGEMEAHGDDFEDNTWDMTPSEEEEEED